MEYQVTQYNQHTVIMLAGEVDAYSVNAFKLQLLELVDETSGSFIIDMYRLDFMDSSAISALIACYRKIEAKNSTFGLLRVTDNLLDILKLATLDRFFPLYSSYEDLP